MPFTDFIDQFNEVVAVTANTDFQTRSVAVILRPASDSKVLITSISPNVLITHTHADNGDAERRVLQGIRLTVIESTAKPDDVAAMSLLLTGNGSVDHKYLRASNMILRYMKILHQENLQDLTNLQVQSSTGKPLYVILGSPEVSGNTSGSPIDVDISLSVYGQYVPANIQDLRKIEFIR